MNFLIFMCVVMICLTVIIVKMVDLYVSDEVKIARIKAETERHIASSGERKDFFNPQKEKREI